MLVMHRLERLGLVNIGALEAYRKDDIRTEERSISLAALKLGGANPEACDVALMQIFELVVNDQTVAAGL